VSEGDVNVAIDVESSDKESKERTVEGGIDRPSTLALEE
jgi:hypothetical protein